MTPEISGTTCSEIATLCEQYLFNKADNYDFFS